MKGVFYISLFIFSNIFCTVNLYSQDIDTLSTDLILDEYFNSETINNSSPTSTYTESFLEQNHFDENQWKEIINGIEYTDKADPKPKADDLPQWNNSMSEFWSGFFKIFSIILGIGLIVILLVNFSGADIFRPKSKKINHEIGNLSIEEIEENFQETNIVSYIDKAIQDKNYPLAVRLYFLEVIKSLDEKEHIKWKKDKTNLTYYYEIKNSTIAKDFQKATRIFERVWYGEEGLQEQTFLPIQNHFKNLLNATNQA